MCIEVVCLFCFVLLSLFLFCFFFFVICKGHIISLFDSLHPFSIYWHFIYFIWNVQISVKLMDHLTAQVYNHFKREKKISIKNHRLGGIFGPLSSHKNFYVNFLSKFT